MLLDSFPYFDYLKLDHCYVLPISLPELFVSSHGGSVWMHPRSYALSWKPCQGDSLNLPDHRIHKDGDGDALFQLKSDSLPHAHAQTTKTYYKHRDSRIMKAQELKTKTSAQTLIYKIFLQRYQVYQGRFVLGVVLIFILWCILGFLVFDLVLLPHSVGSIWMHHRSGVEGVILCLYVLSLRCLLVKEAYECILESFSLFRLLITQMVNIRQSTSEFSGPAFDEAVQRAVNALLPDLTAHIANELRQNGAGSSVDAENWIAHIEKLFEVLGCADEFKAWLASYKLEGDALSWWKAVKQARVGETYVATLPWKDFRKLFFLQYFPRSEHQKYEREYHTIRQRDGEPSGEFMKRFLRLVGFLGKKASTQEEQAKNFKWTLCDWILDGIVNTEFTDVAQVADAARNIEILRERSSQNNKRNRDGDRIRPMTQGNNQRGYDQKMYDGRRCNSDQKSRHNRGQQYNRSSGPSGQKVYPDYASSPPCDICGKLHPGKACYRVTGACFIYGLTGHMARDCPKNGGNGGRGYGNDNQPAAKGRVFSSTKDQATNSSGLVVINHEYQNCPLRVDDKIRFANLFPMDMNDFDVILGMNSGVEGVILCLRVLSLRCLLVKGAYGCILSNLFHSVQSDHEYQNCPLHFDDKIHFTNLPLLELSNFDFILGLNWLTVHRTPDSGIYYHLDQQAWSNH
ncbi:putative reverse transcriptase domain-containing protein [Tanacetum coccineum]